MRVAQLEGRTVERRRGVAGPLVRRDDLVSRLVADRERSALLVAAPAGYGKTTLLRQWLADDDREFAWITLDARHNDPVLLIGSIAAALDEIEPLDEDALAPPLGDPDLADALVPRLCDSLRRRERPFVLVLDDVHRLLDETLKPLGELAESVPRGSMLAFAGRTEPALGVGRLRVRRLLAELGPEDLAMTPDEAAELLASRGVCLGPDAMARLIERTEGWAAGLYLATLYLEAETEPDSAIERFSGDHRLLADYLHDEFLSTLSAEDADFMIRSSILDRLSGEVCDAVLGCEGSAARLRRLRRSNLLLIPLDRRDRQYRCHTLLRELLESELGGLGVRQERELHGRASAWYERDVQPDRAVAHAIAAGDTERAGALIWARTASYASRGRVATLRDWLALLGGQATAASPTLSLTQATVDLSRGDGALVDHWVGTALERLKDRDGSERSELEASARLIRAAGAARDGIAPMRDDVASAYEHLPEDSPWRSIARLIDGVSSHLAGDREQARKLLEEGSRRGGTGAPSIEALCHAQLTLVALDEGNLEEAIALAENAVAQTKRHGLDATPTSALTYAAAALVHGVQGQAATAARELSAAERLLGELNEFSSWYEAEVRIVIARALLVLDDAPAARARLADAARHLKRGSDAPVLRDWIGVAWRDADAAHAVTGRWPLSPAELRLLHFLPTHLSFREIAEELFVSANTVKTQARSIYRKLGVSSRAEAVACARTAGLLEAAASPVEPGPD